MSRPRRVEQENGAIFEALRTMSACYLRADTAAICACIQAFALNDLLFSIARLERLFNKRSCNGAPPPPPPPRERARGGRVGCSPGREATVAARMYYGFSRCSRSMLAVKCLQHWRLFSKRVSKGALSHGG